MWMKIEIEIFLCFLSTYISEPMTYLRGLFAHCPYQKKVNMTQNWLNTIFCGIYNFSSENGAAFSQNWLINISVRYVATIIQVSSEIPPLFIIIVQFSSFEKDHSHHSQVRSLFVLDHLLAHSCCWDSNDVTLADSEENTNLHLNYIQMLMLRQTCIVTVVGSCYN